MNLFERLMYRRLMSEAGEGGEGGGGAAGQTTTATTSQEGSAEGDQSGGDNDQQQQQQQQQQQEGTKSEGDNKQEDKDKKPGLQAPEKYELTAPEGTELDSKAVELFSPWRASLVFLMTRRRSWLDCGPNCRSKCRTDRLSLGGSRLKSGPLTRRLTKKSVATN